MATQIIEHRKDILERIRLLGPSAVEVPDVVDLHIVQPKGVQLHVAGPKNNCQVKFTSSQGEISFNSIPPKTRFEIGDSPYKGFQHRIDGRKHIVSIPAVRALHAKESVLAILHEKGHAVSRQDPEWKEKLVAAHKELEIQLFSRALDGYMWVDKEPEKRERQRAALGVFLEEEMRASKYALQQVANFRDAGIDLVPHRKTTKELMQYLDMALDTHNNSNFAISYGRKRESLYDRTVNRLLGIQPRDPNTTIYLPNWNGVQKRFWFNLGVRGVRMMAIWTAVGVELGEIMTLTGDVTPEKAVSAGLTVGLIGGLLATDQFVDPRPKF